MNERARLYYQRVLGRDGRVVYVTWIVPEEKFLDYITYEFVRTEIGMIMAARVIRSHNNGTNQAEPFMTLKVLTREALGDKPVVFQIACQREHEFVEFVASNGVHICSMHRPRWVQDEGCNFQGRLWANGVDMDRDFDPLTASTADFARIEAAVAEFNVARAQPIEFTAEMLAALPDRGWIE